MANLQKKNDVHLSSFFYRSLQCIGTVISKLQGQCQAQYGLFVTKQEEE